MHKLFVLSHLRALARLGIGEFSPSAWEEAVARNTLAPSGEGLLYRLPREELKHTLNTVCPINSLEQPYAENIILASKALRSNLKTDEEKLCARCPFVQQCSHAKKTHSPLPADQSSSLRDLMYYTHGLHQLLKPEKIFYRQWVAAYRLGDSIVATIDDLSKGGEEIAEYDRLRLEGIQAFAEKMAQKKALGGDNGNEENEKQLKKEGKAEGEEQDEVKEFKDLFKRVDAVAQEKAKPKKKVAPNKESTTPKEEETFGRDFSFDEQAQFEPAQKKFTKKSVEKAESGAAGQKGYQRIEKDEGRPSKGGKAPYNKFNPERQPIEGFEEDYARYKPKGDNRRPYEKGGDRGYRDDRRPKYDREDRNDRYERNDRFDRGDRSDSRAGKYDRPPQRSNERQQWGNERGGERDFRDNRKQDRYGGEGRFDERRGDQGFKPNRQRDSKDDFPRIKQLNRNSQRDTRDQRPSRDSQESYTPKAPKSNPYVQRWQPEQDDFQPKQASPRRNAFDSEPASRPKIIQVEGIDPKGEAPRAGRRGRGRK